MFNPNDGFGKMMISNFKRMGMDLVGIFDYPEMKDIK